MPLLYDKGERVLRIEAIAYNITDLKCGKSLEKLLIMLEKLQRMPINFLEVVQAAHLSFLDAAAPLKSSALPSESQPQPPTRFLGSDKQVGVL